jgi:N-acetylneuraminic acid mutarotase
LTVFGCHRHDVEEEVLGRNAKPLVSGLVAAYGFEEGTGTTIADSSGNGLVGTSYNARWSLGKYGNGLRFLDGRWVTVPDAPSLHLTTGMTLSAWVYPTADLQTWPTVVMKETDGDFDYVLYANSDEGAPGGFVLTQGQEVGAKGTSLLPLNQWSYLATTYDGSTLAIYVDGVLVGSKQNVTPAAESDGPLVIGANDIWGGESFHGLIDEVRIYNRPLAVSEIAHDMQTPIAPAGPDPATIPPRLVAAYGFEETGGATAVDSSGAQLNGSVNGAARVRGKLGNALAFNGSTDAVVVPYAASLDLTAGMSISAWIRPTGPLNTFPCVVMKEVEGDFSYALYASSDNGLPGGWILSAGQEWSARDGAALPLDTWTHLAATYDGLTLKTYLNGVQVASQPIGFDIVASTGALWIGGDDVWQGEHFSGLIDEVRIYDGPQLQADIVRDMSRPVAPPAPSFPLVVGDPVTFAGDDSFHADTLIAEAVQLDEPAKILSLQLYVAAAAGKIRMGIYDASGPEGGPGTLVAQADENTAIEGWNAASISTPTVLQPGTYWLAFLPSDPGLHIRHSGTGSAIMAPFAFGPMPASYSTSGSPTTDHWSFYAVFGPAEPPSSDACSSNGVALPAGTSCSDGNACNGAESCDGAGHCVAGSPIVCSALDACHVAGSCDPATGACSNPTRPDGTNCDDGNACTTVDQCTGGVCHGTSVVCAALDSCHDPGTCDPSSGQCSNPPKANGTACDDGDACTGSDSCQAGACVGSNPVICAASDACHLPGVCDHVSGQCSNPSAADGTPCNDGNACTTIDRCTGGVCQGTSPVVCSAIDQCHDSGTCNPGSGQCSTPPKPNGTSCDDHDACTRSDSCQAGACVGSNSVVCAASDSCHLAGVCDKGTGQCSNPAAGDGTACDDGNACTRSDACQAGVCHGGNPVACQAQDQCHAAGACDPSTGACSNPAKPDGTTCDDGDACTKVDRCEGGACHGTTPVSCAALDACHDVGTCNSSTGQCSNPSKANGTACDDHDACTRADSCQEGACVGANPVVCAATDACHVAGVCNSTNGQCSNPAANDGTSCDDGNACTLSDACQAGVCHGGNPVTCAAQDPCHAAGTCDPSTGACSNPAKANGSVCDDGNACTQIDTCQQGACVGSSSITCAASDPCHLAGVCNPSTGACSNPTAPDDSACDDGNACTLRDTCLAGKCTGSNAVQCAASDACHVVGTCDPSTGVCSSPAKPNGSVCDDGNRCTQGDNCTDGACQPGGAVVVDDGNPCTTDRCDSVAGVVHVPTASGASCADATHPNYVCDGQGNCVASACTVQDDGNPCTVDTCDPSTGQTTHTLAAANTPCSDGDQCNGLETCDGSGHCVAGPRPVWDDHNDCTVDWCDRATGMHHAPLDVDLSGPKTCMVGCLQGLCTSTGACDTSNSTFRIGWPCETNDPCRDMGTCDTTGACIPGDPLPGEVCKTNSCDFGTCDANGQCHIDGFQPAGTACGSRGEGDGDYDCNGPNACNAVGICEAGPPRPDGTALPLQCDSDSRFYVSSTCRDGIPIMTRQKVPDDGNTCTNDTCTMSCGPNGCSPAQLTHPPKAQGTTCDASADPCMKGPGTCNATGTCVANPGTATVSPRGTPCGPGDVCAGTGHVCDGSGQCLTMSLDVDDHNPCTGDVCDPSTLTVTHFMRTRGFECGPGDVCGGTGQVCDGAGQCFTTSLQVDDHDACTIDICDRDLLQVRHLPVDVDDGNPCTADACSSTGGVTHVAAVGAGCSNGHTDRCVFTAATCNAQGQCTDQPVVIDDGNPCTIDFCDSSVGVGHLPVDVDDGNPCTVDSCNPLVGILHTPATAGATCSDGNPCNGLEICNGQGACVAGVPPEIDDQNVCTTDSCGPNGVVHTPVAGGTPCRDANLCNGNEFCDGAGACVAGAPPAVDDGNPCTVDSCDPLNGVSHVETNYPACAAQRSSWAALAGGRYSPRDSLSMAYDESMGRLVVFGGLNDGAALSDTWNWDRTSRSWTLSHAKGPSARAGAAMAYDKDRLRVVLFGGVTGAAGSAAYLNDVWEYDTLADAWEQRTTSEPPPPRAYASFAYDSALGTFVLFGGVAAGGSVDMLDTWEYSGATNAWTRHDTVSAPPARGGGAMVYDSTRARFVLFGGGPLAQSSSHGTFADTWEYDNAVSTWTRRTTTTSPPARTAHAMAYDEARQRVVLFGGTGNGPSNLGDVWEFDGTQWTATNPAVAPPGRAGLAMAYDSADHSIWVAGGLSYSASGQFTPEYDDLWRYRSADGWMQMGSTLAPSATVGPMVFDTARQRFVVRGASYRPFTWELDVRTGHWDPRPAVSEQSDWGVEFVNRNINDQPFAYDTGRGKAVLLDQTKSGNEVLWEWDGQKWTRRACPGGPPSSVGAGGPTSQGFDPPGTILAGAFDTVHRNFVFYRGDVGTEGNPDPFPFASDAVYELDTSACVWATRKPPAPPPHFKEASMVWDSDRGRVLLYAPMDGQTWEWDSDGNAWTQRITTTAPPKRHHHALVYDPLRKRVVLFGGGVPVGGEPDTWLNDTWEFDPAAGAWEQKSPAISPDPREGASVGFDPQRGRVVLQGGGRGLVGVPNWGLPGDARFDRWEWDGSSWRPLDLGVAPGARDGAAGAFISQPGLAVLFGGASGNGQRDYLQDTWVYRGGFWGLASAPSFDNSPRQFQTGFNIINNVQAFTPRTPPGRAGHAMASGFRSEISNFPGSVLLFGGEGDTGLLGDSWVFDETTYMWSFVDDPQPGRRDHAMALLPEVGYLMFGGQDATGKLLGDTWAWTSGWVNESDRVGSPAPSPRRNLAMATDLARNKVVLFGGRNDSGALGDTWEFDLVVGSDEVEHFVATGSHWTLRTPVQAPLARWGHQLTYDPVRKKVLLTGGIGRDPDAPMRDTWEWDGDAGTWTIRKPTAPLEPRAGHLSFFDEATARSIVFGGLSHRDHGAAAMAFGDVATFDHPELSAGESQTLPNGVKCEGNASCESGRCVDGVCCNSPCDSQCAACDVAGFEGICTPTTGTPHGSRPSCGSDSICGLHCDGSDMNVCHFPPQGTACAAAGCTSGFVHSAAYCDGNGACNPPAENASCEPYACISTQGCQCTTPMVCNQVCFADADCFSSAYGCVPRGPGLPGQVQGDCKRRAVIQSVSFSPEHGKVGETISAIVIVQSPDPLVTFRITDPGGNVSTPCNLARAATNTCPFAATMSGSYQWTVETETYRGLGSFFVADDTRSSTYAVAP